MRILELLPSLDPRAGGTAEAVRQVVRVRAGLVERQTVVTLDDPSGDLPPLEGGELLRWGPVRGFYGYLPGLPQRLRSLAQDHDLVVVNGLWQYHALAAVRALGRPGATPYVVWPHGMLDPWFNRRYPLKRLKKLLYWPLADARLIRHAAAVCFTAEEERCSARASFPWYHPRERVLGFGIVDPPASAPAQQAAFLAVVPQARNRRVLLFLGRLHEKKGVDFLVGAAGELESDQILVMAGPDPDGWQARLMGTYPTDRVVWPGMLRGDAKWGALRSAEAFCLISHQENFGIAVVEALACGTPVLISRAINIHNDITAAGAGLSTEDTTDGARMLLRQWRNLDARQRIDMRDRARRCWSERFDLRRVIADQVDAYRRIIAGAVQIDRAP